MLEIIYACHVAGTECRTSVIEYVIRNEFCHSLHTITYLHCVVRSEFCHSLHTITYLHCGVRSEFNIDALCLKEMQYKRGRKIDKKCHQFLNTGMLQNFTRSLSLQGAWEKSDSTHWSPWRITNQTVNFPPYSIRIISINIQDPNKLRGSTPSNHHVQWRWFEAESLLLVNIILMGTPLSPKTFALHATF